VGFRHAQILIGIPEGMERGYTQVNQLFANQIAKIVNSRSTPTIIMLQDYTCI
jgi:trehalose-6-phosphate synthase